MSAPGSSGDQGGQPLATSSNAPEASAAGGPAGDAGQLELSIVIPSWNTRDLLRVCLRTIAEADTPEHEIIVVDNASADGSADMVAAEFPDVRLIREDTNTGFARGCNIGIAAATGRFVLIHNADTEVYPDSIRLMLDFLRANPAYGAAAPRLVNADGSTQGGCMAFPGWWTPLFFGTPLERWFPNSPELKRYFLRAFDHESDCDVDQPPAACFLVRHDVLREVGAFDEQFWLFFNDVDLSLRLSKAGYRTRFVADARVMHHVGASTSQFQAMHVEWQKNRLAYYRKHFGKLGGAWVKACVGLTFWDYRITQGWRKLRKRPHEPVAPMRAAYQEFKRL